MYLVKIKGGQRTVRRIFLWTEKRFGEIPCGVFTSQVAAKHPARVTDTGTVAISRSGVSGGGRLPVSEVSIPHYDIETCTLA